MEQIKAKEYNEKIIQLENAQMLEKVYSIIEADENFILQWKEKEGVIKSEVIITTNISSKVKNGDLKLTSEESIEE